MGKAKEGSTRYPHSLEDDREETSETGPSPIGLVREGSWQEMTTQQDFEGWGDSERELMGHREDHQSFSARVTRAPPCQPQGGSCEQRAEALTSRSASLPVQRAPVEGADMEPVRSASRGSRHGTSEVWV